MSVALASVAAVAGGAAIAPAADAAPRGCPNGAVCLYPNKGFGGKPDVNKCSNVAGVVVSGSKSNRASSAVNNCPKAVYLFDAAFRAGNGTQLIKVRKSLWIGPRQWVRDLGARRFDNITDGIATIPRPTVNL